MDTWPAFSDDWFWARAAGFFAWLGMLEAVPVCDRNTIVELSPGCPILSKLRASIL